MRLAAAEDRVHGVAGRPRLLGDDHPLLAEERVDEARLAHVGAAEDGDPDRLLPHLRRALARKLGHDAVEQVARAVPVQGGERHRLAQPERVELERVRVAAGVVHLVGDDDHGLVGAAQDVGDFLVARGDAGARVHDEEHEVGLGDGQAGLLGDPLRERRRVGDVDPARVHEDEALARPLADDLLAVARYAGRLENDGLARGRQAVDERRLADVGKADDRDDAEERRVTYS